MNYKFFEYHKKDLDNFINNNKYNLNKTGIYILNEYVLDSIQNKTNKKKSNNLYFEIFSILGGISFIIINIFLYLKVSK
ncbi:unnamed protein product, partial [marine sediment metagenome]